MRTKILTTIIILLIAGAAAFAYIHYKNNQQSQNSQNNQQTQDNSQAQSGQTQAAECPNGTNVTQTDSNGRFKPTIDISNKVATVVTSMGTFKIQLYDKDAPKTVENFVCLAQKGYFNGITFHRVAHGFVIQSGDPTGTGSGGTSVYGPTFEDELYSDTASYQAGYLHGVVAMANRGPNTNGSQFFVLTADHPELPHAYTIFGKVIEGLDVVDKIGAVPVTPGFGPDDGTPVSKVTITSVTISNSNQ